jgi:5-methylthioadenosine/S-adenosylhomocysteine deaminase
MYDVLIQDATIVDPQGSSVEILPGYDVAIRGNRVAAVQPTGQIRPEQAIEVISGIGMAAMPGLLNTHAHCAMVLFR